MNRYEFNRFRNKLRRCKLEVLDLKAQIDNLDTNSTHLRKRTSILANQLVNITSQLTICQAKEVLKFNLHN